MRFFTGVFFSPPSQPLILSLERVNIRSPLRFRRSHINIRKAEVGNLNASVNGTVRATARRRLEGPARRTASATSRAFPGGGAIGQLRGTASRHFNDSVSGSVCSISSHRNAQMYLKAV